MEYTNFKLSVADGVAAITLSRPEKLNALTAVIWEELDRVLSALQCDSAVRALLLCGEGRAFCAGFDLKASSEEEDSGVFEQWEGIQRQHDIMLRLWDFPKPVVAAVQGYCLGGGYELANLADLIIAADDAVFGLTEMRYSLVPKPNTVWLVGARKAKEILLLAEKFDAWEAQRIGLINRVVPRDQLEAEARRMAVKLARMPEETMRMTKRIINKAIDAQGFRETGDWGWDLFLLSKLTETKLRAEFDKIGSEQGMKAAFQWINSRFDV